MVASTSHPSLQKAIEHSLYILTNIWSFEYLQCCQTISLLLVLCGDNPRGWGMWKMYQTLTIFFHGFGWTPLPLLLYKVCFSEFRCFCECFFVPQSQFLYLQPQPTYLSTHKLSNHSWRCSACKSLHGGTYMRNYQKQWVLQVFRLPSILSLGLVQLKSWYLTTVFKQSIHFPWS